MTTDIRLRESTPSDLPFITSLERHPDNRELIGQWSDDEHLAAMRGDERWSHWILELDGVPAGYLIARDCRGLGVGIYIKRILVAEKERGTGQAALRAFVDMAFDRMDAALAWLIVRNENARAQAVYRKLGFEPFQPSPEGSRRFDAVAEAPAERCFRMRLLRRGK